MIFIVREGSSKLARINIEESLFQDINFELLKEKLGRFAAAGAVVYLWRLGQKYWLKGHSPIPEKQWQMAGLPEELIECDFAFRVEGGFEVKGAEKHFEWIERFIEGNSKGGKVSAQRPRDEKGRLLPKHSQVESKSSPSGLGPDNVFEQVEQDLSKTQVDLDENPSGPGQMPKSSPSQIQVTPALLTPYSFKEHPQTPSGFVNVEDVAKLQQESKPERHLASLKPDDPVMAFENRMRGNDNAWLEVLRKIYSPAPPDAAVIRSVPKIRALYDNDVEHFKLEMEELWNSADGKDSERTYITVSIKRKLGLMPERRAE
jgi:hypothetical protein